MGSQILTLQQCRETVVIKNSNKMCCTEKYSDAIWQHKNNSKTDLRNNKAPFNPCEKEEKERNTFIRASAYSITMGAIIGFSAFPASSLPAQSVANWCSESRRLLKNCGEKTVVLQRCKLETATCSTALLLSLPAPIILNVLAVPNPLAV